MNDINNIKMRAYKDSDGEQIRDFLKKNWCEDHPICEKALFDWQFQGFGSANKEISSVVMLNGDEVIGFRGVIPGLYQVPSKKNKMDVIKGGSLAMWMIRKDYRGRNLGHSMHIEAQKAMVVITGAGSNLKTSVPIYLKNGFSMLEAMNRYVIPLDAQGYHQLLSQKVNIRLVKEWVELWLKCKIYTEPGKLDIETTATVWEKTTFPLRIFSLYRNTEFWKWRYIDSPGFDYLFFGDARGEGLVVARIERIYSNDNMELHGKKVFRIIEILPGNNQAWQRKIDPSLIKIIQGSIHWAKQQGCFSADFYCSTSRFDPILATAGFRKQNINLEPPICSLARMFQPLKYLAHPINALYRVAVSEKGLMSLSFEDIYMVKSENDMDRPNLLASLNNRDN